MGQTQLSRRMCWVLDTLGQRFLQRASLPPPYKQGPFLSQETNLTFMQEYWGRDTHSESSTDAAALRHKITEKGAHQSCLGNKFILRFQTIKQEHALPAPSVILWHTHQLWCFNSIWIIPVLPHCYQVCLKENYFICRGENHNCNSTRIHLIKCNEIIPCYVVNKYSIVVTHASNKKPRLDIFYIYST